MNELKISEIKILEGLKEKASFVTNAVLFIFDLFFMIQYAII